MKRRDNAILQPAQEAYLDRLLPPGDPLLREMEARAAAEDIPISDAATGRLLAILARSIGARRILELGTAIGYGAILLARAAPEARIVSVDKSPERLAEARGYLERAGAGVAGRVELVEGAALDVLHRLEGPFDLVYVDAMKTEYRRYLDLTLPKLRVGGLIVCDNLLWGGEIAVPGDEEDKDADALRAFNGYLMMHPQLQAVVLPLGDGVGLATKTKPTIMEMGGPY
jgi:predicted O-methyltransferase YrrM